MKYNIYKRRLHFETNNRSLFNIVIKRDRGRLSLRLTSHSVFTDVFLSIGKGYVN